MKNSVVKSKILIGPILFLLLAVFTASLKQTDAGVNDWHLKNIGEIQKLEFLNNPKLLFFYSQIGMFGHLEKSTGNIEKRISLNSQNSNNESASQKERLIGINQLPQSGKNGLRFGHQIIIATSFNQLLIYNSETMDKVVENRFVNEKDTLGEIRAYWKKQNGLLYVAGNKQLRMYPDGSPNHQVIHSFNQQTQSILAIGEVKNTQHQENSNLVIVLKSNQKVCIKEVLGKTLDQKSQINKCYDVSQQSAVQRAEISQKQFLCLSTKVEKNAQCFDVFNGTSVKILKANNIFLEKEDYLNTQDVKTRKYRFIGDKNQIQIQQDISKKIAIFRNDYRLSQVQNYGDAAILNFWIDFKSEIDYNVVIQFKDLTLSSYHSTERRELIQSWKREESLAYISKVLFMSTQIQNSLDNSYHRKMLSSDFKSKNIMQKIIESPLNFFNRLKNQLSDIKAHLIHQIGSLEWISSVFEINSKDDLKNIMKFKMSEQQERRYGLRKHIIVFTKRNTIVCLDSKTSKILWKKNEQEYLKGKQLISLIKIKKDYQLEAAIAILYVPNERKIIISEIDIGGNIHILKEFIDSENSEAIFSPTVHKLNDFSVLIKGQSLHKFAINNELSQQFHQKQYYFYSVQRDKQIIGYVQDSQKLIPIWNFKFSDNETLIETKTSFKADHGRIALVDQEKVIFKNIDATNIAVVTRIGLTNTMHVYSINGRTGHVQFNQQKTGVCFDLENHPINLAYDQNNILVTYYSLRNRLYQIWTIQQYQDRVQNSALSILKGYFSGESHSKATHNRNQIIFLSEVYGSVVPIKHIFISESKLSLIRRNMIIITPMNECYMIMRELISARRPKETAIFQNQKYPIYEYLLPYNPVSFFTHLNVPARLSHIRFGSTNLESTIFVMAYGVDAFLIRMAPDKTFDMITEDFNYLVLVLIVIVVTGIVLWLRRKMKFAKLTKNHRD